MNIKKFIKALYENVDAKNTDHLNEVLSKAVHFRIGNHDAVIGKPAVLEANRNFFNSIASMSHTIENVWGSQEDIICNGQVDYVRLNGSRYSAPFATVLKMQENQIRDYRVYADISEL